MRWFILTINGLLLIAGNNVWGAETADPGKKLFESKCAQCHGKDAKGQPKMADVLLVEPALIDLTRKDAVKLSFEDKVKIVTMGKNKMLKFKKKITDEQIQQVVKYLESLQKTGGENKK
jgi:mono/diheme cytochrome c family protein